jgi:hypothetical protein
VLLVAQVMITRFMAVSMSGIMSAVGLGLTWHWLANWPKQFVIAWPIAVLPTQVYGRLVFAVAGRIVLRRD